MPIINSNFKPARGLKSPHLQTMWGKIFNTKCDHNLVSERLELDDGDFIDVAKSKYIVTQKIVVMLHGLEGCIDSHYVKPLVNKLENEGYAVYFMHFRGCSGEMNRLARSYSSNDTADLQFVIDNIVDTHKRQPFAVIGFSLGGSVVLKWLGSQQQDANTVLGVAISVPFRLGDTAQKLESGFSRLYQRYLIRTCHKKYLEKQKLHPALLKENVEELTTFYSFDDKVTAPLNGFKDVDDYYEQCSSRQYLKSIKKPTLIIHSKDDPFMWDHTAPNEHELSKDVQLELTEKGGHVGFISGKYPWETEYWLDHRILEWLNENHNKN